MLRLKRRGLQREPISPALSGLNYNHPFSGWWGPDHTAPGGGSWNAWSSAFPDFGPYRASARLGSQNWQCSRRPAVRSGGSRVSRGALPTGHTGFPARPYIGLALGGSKGISSGRRGIRQHLALAALDQGAQVVMPQRQRVAHLALVCRAVINASDAAAIAAKVVELGLNDVLLHADVGHFGGDASSNIVHRPISNLRALVERRFALFP